MDAKKEIENVASDAAQSAFVGSPGVGVAKGKREITVPAADLKWEDMHPGSPVKFSVLWGDYKKGPFGMLLKQPGGFECRISRLGTTRFRELGPT